MRPAPILACNELATPDHDRGVMLPPAPASTSVEVTFHVRLRLDASDLMGTINTLTMSAEHVSRDEALALLDGANDFEAVDPGSYCNGSMVECSLAGDCHGEHPTGRLSALCIDAGEESETLYFAEEVDAKLAAAAPCLARTVVALHVDLDQRDAALAVLRRELAERDAALTKLGGEIGRLADLCVAHGIDPMGGGR